MFNYFNSIATNLFFLILIFFATKFLIQGNSVAFIANSLKQSPQSRLPCYLLYIVGAFVVFILINLTALVHNGNERLAYFLNLFLYISSVFILNYFFGRIFPNANATQNSIIVSVITAVIGWVMVEYATRIGFVNELLINGIIVPVLLFSLLSIAAWEVVRATVHK